MLISCVIGLFLNCYVGEEFLMLVCYTSFSMNPSTFSTSHLIWLMFTYYITESKDGRYTFLRNSMVRAKIRYKTVTNHVPCDNLQQFVSTDWILSFLSIVSNVRVHMSHIVFVFECIEIFIKIDTVHAPIKYQIRVNAHTVNFYKKQIIYNYTQQHSRKHWHVEYSLRG